MLSLIKKNLFLFTASALIVFACTLLGYGVWLLESSSHRYGLSYLLLGAGGALLVFLPRSMSLAGPLTGGRLGAFVLIALAAASQFVVFLDIKSSPINLFDRIMVFWGLSLILFALASRTLDIASETESNDEPVLNRPDILIALGFVIVSFVVRRMGHPTAAVDEVLVFSEMNYWYLFNEQAPWHVSGSAVPFILSRMLYHISRLLSPVIDGFDVLKGAASLVGSVSVGAWYLAVRRFNSRVVAFGAALLLLCLGWHWINSRLAYLYTYDLMNLAIAVWCAATAFERRSYLAATVAGFFTTYAVFMKKFGMLLFPFLVYMFVDYLLTTRKEERKRIAWLGFVLLAAGVFAYLPLFFGNYSEVHHPNITSALATRARRLAEFNMEPMMVPYLLFIDAFRHLQIETYDMFRHVLRINKPILDPVLSLLFSLGIVLALVRSFRGRQYRFQLVGLVLFLLPMIISFPFGSELPRGLSRRMLGACFFVTWLGATGAELLASRLVRARLVPGVTLSLCIVSLLTNAFFLKAHYESPVASIWYTDHGGARASAIQFARKLAKNMNVLVLNDNHMSLVATNYDQPTLKYLPSLDDVRREIKAKPRQWYAVVVPCNTASEVSSQVFNQMADLVPPWAWIQGDKDLHDIPMFRYAFIFSLP